MYTVTGKRRTFRSSSSCKRPGTAAGALLKFTGGTALVGFDRFGKPLIYAAFAIALALPAHAPIARASESAI
jgi:hypothetical protein